MTSNRYSTSRSLAAIAGLLAGAIGLCAAAAPSRAEVQIGVYGGFNTNLDSPGTLHKGGIVDVRTMEWEGRSFGMPPYWGVQVTYWLNRGAGWGVSFDYTHTKAYANLNFISDPIYKHLEFTDGNNLYILNLMYRFEGMMGGKLVPYVGIGGGVTVPHVEVRLKAFPGEQTWEYQLAGGAAQVIAGLDYRINDAWSVFAQGKLSYSHLDADLTGGGKFKTYLYTPQFGLGISYRFGN